MAADTLVRRYIRPHRPPHRHLPACVHKHLTGSQVHTFTCEYTHHIRLMCACTVLCLSVCAAGTLLFSFTHTHAHTHAHTHTHTHTTSRADPWTCARASEDQAGHRRCVETRQGPWAYHRRSSSPALGEQSLPGMNHEHKESSDP